MSPERRHIPDWASRKRQRDLEWIGENLHVFLPAAQSVLPEQGRGAIVVDTTSRPTDEGHPFVYFPQDFFEKEWEDEDIQRMVREYNPKEEIVVVLLKSENRTSTYRVKPVLGDN